MELSNDWLSNLKLCIGYGVIGNLGGIGVYGIFINVIIYFSLGISIGGNNVLFVQYIGIYFNLDFGWEKLYNWNIGVDFGFLSNCIDGLIEWFIIKMKGLLFKCILFVIIGNIGWGCLLDIWENLVEISNMGVEVIINFYNIKIKDFLWDIILLFIWSKEKINFLFIGDLIKENLFEGQLIYVLYDYKYVGIWGSNVF